MAHDPQTFSARFEDALAYLATFEDLERGGMAVSRLGLERIRHLLAALGDPQQRFPSVLIAGTKGKGSTAAMIERALRAEGYRTGLYTQPHLHTIRERVRLDGVPISPELFADAMAPVRAAVDAVCDAESPTTAYEAMTALALNCFSDQQVDVAVLEVGLGGRLDATNVVDASVSVLTSISLDHTQILGNTLPEIAGEKADIIKPGHPCVSAPQDPQAMAVIERVAQARSAPLLIAGQNGAYWAKDGDRLSMVMNRGVLPDVQLALAGGFQRINALVAATALEALDAIGERRVSLAAIRAGIEAVEWPGRFEVVERDGRTFVLDGAHNVDSAQQLTSALAERFGGAPRQFVLGITSDKDVAGIVAALRPAEGVIATRSSNPRATDPERLADLARAAGLHALVAPDVASALRQAAAQAQDAIVVVTGSLYVVAEAREALGLVEANPEAQFNPWASR